MLYSEFLFLILFSCRVCPSAQDKEKSSEDFFGADLISKLKNDVNLDLSLDEEYEDLRAELLAYHTALATLTSARRGMVNTPCWELGGICVNYKLCSGHRYLTQVAGCKNKLNVCCFTWNRYEMRDFSENGIGSAVMPWSLQQEYGGKGILIKKDKPARGKKKRPKKNTAETQAFVI